MPEKGEREKVQRLQLQVNEVREAVRAESPREPGEIRPRFRAGDRAHEHMHRQRAGDERGDEQDVVAEHHVVRDGVERRKQDALQQQVIGVRQRPGGRIEDVRVEHGAVEQDHVSGSALPVRDKGKPDHERQDED